MEFHKIRVISVKQNMIICTVSFTYFQSMKIHVGETSFKFVQEQDYIFHERGSIPVKVQVT